LQDASIYFEASSQAPELTHVAERHRRAGAVLGHHSIASSVRPGWAPDDIITVRRYHDLNADSWRLALPDVQRRLAAILAADVVGYSRLMAADEERTLARLKSARREIVDPLIADNRGRLVKLTGDGALVEFFSAVDAVRCAVAIQEAMAERTRSEPDAQRISFRVGINVGDVIIDGDDLYGDGVNVAARLEGLADPGSVFVSGQVYDHVVGKLSYRFELLGERQLKNIDRRVPVYRVLNEPAAVASSKAPATPTPETGRDKPSMVVLPFANMSGDPEQEFFVDGLTEDIITELSRFRQLFVISRNSSFVYKGKAVNARDVARDLGVQYLLEGSARKAGARVRVTVQLIDAETDSHLWAERYDRQLEDIFAVQDELTTAIVAILHGRVEDATYERAKRKPPDSMLAYEYVLAGKRLHHRAERAANIEALGMMDRAIALDPKYAHARAWRGCILGQAAVNGWCQDLNATIAEVAREMQTALALDENDSDIHRILAAVNLLRKDFDRVSYHQQRALALNSNDDLIAVQQGEILTWLGQPQEGIEWIRKAMRLNPFHPERFWNHLGRAYFVARRYADAIEAFKHIHNPDYSHHAFLAACYAQMGDAAGADAHVAEVRKRAPDFRVSRYLAALHYGNDADIAHHREALLHAGLPE
jgi:adenylate cyclase